MTVQLKNNAVGFLASAISNSDISATLTSGSGATFPAAGGSDYFYATISTTAGGYEIVKVTNKSGDVFTIVRAQEGTSASSFAAGSRVELRVTAQAIIDAINDRLTTKDDASEISYTPGGSGAVATTVQTKLRESISAEDFGAVGDGSANDTAALQAAINALTAGDTLVLSGNYKVNASLTITNKSRIRITGKGRVFLDTAPSGSYIFKLVGTCDDVEIDGLTLVGDNNSSYTQTAIGCDSGQTISNTRFHHLNISNINVGISHNANLGGSWTKGFCYSNSLKDILGTVSGSGYGIQMAKATNVAVTDNVLDNCGRHSIYQGAGTNCNNVIANNLILNHRNSVADGSFRAAAVISRSSGVTFTGNKFYNCKDCCLEISHVTSDAANCTNVLVEANTFTNRGNAVHTILIGEQATPTAYSTSYVSIFNNTFDDDLAVTAALPPNIYILNGTNITIENNRFVRRNVTTSLSSCILYGDNTYLSASTELNNLIVRNNTATADGTAGTAGFITVCSTAATGTNYYWVKDNYAQNWPKLIAWDATPTNANSFLRFRINVTHDFGSVSAASGAFAALTVEGCKPTSRVRGRPQYSLVTNPESYTFFARDDATNTVVIQVVNVSGSPINPPSQVFVIDIEDVEPYYG
jgi:hypothetical protein